MAVVHLRTLFGRHALAHFALTAFRSRRSTVLALHAYSLRPKGLKGFNGRACLRISHFDITRPRRLNSFVPEHTLCHVIAHSSFV